MPATPELPPAIHEFVKREYTVPVWLLALATLLAATIHIALRHGWDSIRIAPRSNGRASGQAAAPPRGLNSDYYKHVVECSVNIGSIGRLRFCMPRHPTGLQRQDGPAFAGQPGETK